MNFKEWMKKIEKDNKAFKKANKARKRVMIAKDVIKALEVKVLDGSGGGYVMIDDDSSSEALCRAPDNADFRDILVKNSIPYCTVCAKGAIFACTVMRRDKVTKGKMDNIHWRSGPSLSNALEGLFSTAQLNLIENHFELFGDVWNWIGEPPFEKYPYGNDRMVAIMKNIINNKGTFKPELEK